MNNQSFGQFANKDTPKEADPFLAEVGSLLTKRIMDGPSSREAEVASNFATYLRVKRQQCGLSRAMLAQRVGKTEFDIYVLEQGITLPHQIDYVLLNKLAAALDDEPEFLALILERDMARVASPPESSPLRLLDGWYGAFRQDHKPSVQTIGVDELCTDKKQDGWSLRQWVRNYETRLFSRNMGLSTAYAVGILLLILFLPAMRSSLVMPTEMMKDVQLPVSQPSVDRGPITEQQGSVKIVYIDADEVDAYESVPAPSAYFVVDQQRMAAVSLIAKPVRLNRWGCDMKMDKAYGPCQA